MHKPKQLVDWDFDRPENDGEIPIIDLYKQISPELVNEYNNLVEVVNMLIDELKKEKGFALIDNKFSD